MTSTLRCLAPAIVLALSALILSSGASLASLGLHAAPALLVVLVHVWVVAVAERTCPDRGGKDIKRFPLGPRLVEGGAGTTVQLLVPLVLMSLATRSMAVAGGGLAVLVVLSTATLRRMLPFVVPAVAAIWAVVTMDEFHTLTDLLESARGWVFGMIGIILGSFVLGGPLLRTDLGGTLTARGRLVLVMAGLPTYFLGVLVAARPELVGGAPPDLLALAGGVLLGGLLQSFMVALLGKSGDIAQRDPLDYPDSGPRDVGMGLTTVMLPVLAVTTFGWLALPPSWASVAPPAAWAGLMALLMIVPAVPTAVLVGWGLDRADGRPTSRRVPLVTGIGLGLWFLLGPVCLGWMYGPGGLAAGLRSAFSAVPAPWPVTVGEGASASLGGSLLGGGLTLHGLPAADLARGVTLMLAATAALTVRTLRYAHLDQAGVRWGTFVLAAVLSLAGAVVLMPRIGPSGAPLAVTAGCLVMLLVDTCQETSRRNAAARAEELADASADAPLA